MKLKDCNSIKQLIIQSILAMSAYMELYGNVQQKLRDTR